MLYLYDEEQNITKFNWSYIINLKKIERHRMDVVVDNMVRISSIILLVQQRKLDL